jgi:ethanolamine ammonia-lyase large subunit
MSLKDRTLYAIDSLEKLKLWEQGKVKEHFSELTFILRSYLSTRYEINLLEKTSHETKLLLLQKGLHEETVRVISNILMEADLVKFAKSHPDEIAIYKHTQLVRQVVAETSPIEFLDAE